MKENGLWLAAACRDKACFIWGVWYGNEKVLLLLITLVSKKTTNTKQTKTNCTYANTQM